MSWSRWHNGDVSGMGAPFSHLIARDVSDEGGKALFNLIAVTS
jgi:hypothetical protein